MMTEVTVKLSLEFPRAWGRGSSAMILGEGRFWYLYYLSVHGLQTIAEPMREGQVLP